MADPHSVVIHPLTHGLVRPKSVYIVASRQGLYLVDHHQWRQVAEGYFFGVTVKDSCIYCFKTASGEGAAANANSGSIVRYRYRGEVLTGPEVLVEGLDYNCHQVDFFHDSFWVVDSGHQRVLEFDAQWRRAATHPIGPPVERRGTEDAHINSFLGCGQRIFLMFHNKCRQRPSEIVEFDRAFRELGRTLLPSTGCHDVVRLEDGRLLYCESPKGGLALSDGTSFKIDELYTRGLAVGAQEIAVGSSWYGARPARGVLPGFVTFLDRSYARIARLYLPAAPTQIRLLNGADLSLSSPR